MEKPQCTASILLPPYFANLAVFPSPFNESEESRFYLLKNTDTVPVHGLSSVSVKYYPGSVYCFYPSDDENIGTVTVYSSKPSFLDEFSFCLEMNKQAMEFNVQETDHVVEMKGRDDVSSPSTGPGAVLVQRSSCKSCFISHFPRPNTKTCRGAKMMRTGVVEQTKRLSVRLRGGASIEDDGSLGKMKDRAMFNARFHGISMHPGVENLGNCFGQYKYKRLFSWQVRRNTRLLEKSVDV